MQESKKKPSSIMWWVCIFICIAMFVFGGLYFVHYYQESASSMELYAQIAQIHDSVLLDPNYKDSSIEAIVDPGFKERTFLEECSKLYELNSDLVGWICIPGTVINYPVMQTSIDNRDFYLNHDFYGDYNAHGCIYAAEDCDINKPSDVITLYGHHMRNGSMFADLDKYKNEEFWENHQYFTFDTLYEHHIYQVVAVFKINANSDFRYHMYTDFFSEADFNDFISKIMGMSFYNTGLTVEYGDKLVCLSTCEFTLGDGRFVVVGKRVS